MKMHPSPGINGTLQIVRVQVRRAAASRRARLLPEADRQETARGENLGAPDRGFKRRIDLWKRRRLFLNSFPMGSEVSLA